MAEFKEELVINALHADKAIIGKKYWYSDNLSLLKTYVEENNMRFNGKLTRIEGNDICPFHLDRNSECFSWQYLYPYKEPPKQRMTNRMLSEWLIKGNGERKRNYSDSVRPLHSYDIYKGNDFVDENIRIRPWDSEEWIEPTVDIYERDCKGGKE